MARPLEKARSGGTAQLLRAGAAILPAGKPAHKSALCRLAGPPPELRSLPIIHQTVGLGGRRKLLAGTHFGEERMIGKFFADESGATGIEYSFVAGMLLLVVVGIASTGNSLGALYQKVGFVSVAMGGGAA